MKILELFIYCLDASCNVIVTVIEIIVKCIPKVKVVKIHRCFCISVHLQNTNKGIEHKSMVMATKGKWLPLMVNL